MKQTKLIMGMPITVEILDEATSLDSFEKVFNYFEFIDQKFSTYKPNSEVSKINDGKIKISQYSNEMKKVLRLSEQTKNQTDGYFDVFFKGKFDPSGIVKGWAIWGAFRILKNLGYKNFYVDAGGDIQVSGKNKQDKLWRVGIKNPFNQSQIVKVLAVEDKGVATSGNYIKGEHIYDPKKGLKRDDIVSLTVIGPNIYEADRFATAAFAMGKKGIEFIEKLNGFEGYLIDNKGIATFTSGLEKFSQ